LYFPLIESFNNRALRTIWVIALTGFVFLGSTIFKTSRLHAIPDKNPFMEIDAASEVPFRFQKLIGSWLRPDGGYILEIRHVDAEGNMDVRYFNPKPINVSKAVAGQDKGEVKLFVELTDVGYPGAAYLLTYIPEQNILAGVYHQPAANRSFEVVFIRNR
jgi:hypothetical protein